MNANNNYEKNGNASNNTGNVTSSSIRVILRARKIINGIVIAGYNHVLNGLLIIVVLDRAESLLKAKFEEK